MNRWIGVHEELPTPGVVVLGWYGEDRRIHLVFWDDVCECWRFRSATFTQAPTHWFRWPTPPTDATR